MLFVHISIAEINLFASTAVRFIKLLKRFSQFGDGKPITLEQIV